MIRNLLTILIIVITISFSFSKESYAHPGATAADGCHYCRTNCDKYGVAWNERHCHGSNVSPQEAVPSYNPSTTPTTPKPTPQPIPPVSKPKTIPQPKPTTLADDQTYKVVEVIDGDTLKVMLNGKKVSVRLLGIDSPEMGDSRKLVRCFANKAKSKLSDLVLGKELRFNGDKSQGDKDKYSRFLRYIYLNDGTFVNLGVVKDGYAYSYRKYPTKYLGDFNNAEKEAREKKVGLWGNVCQ